MKKTRQIEKSFEFFRVIVAVLLSYVITLCILVLISDMPLEIIRNFLLGPFSSLARIGDMISLAIPLMLTGLCMCFMYSINKFNLSAESIFIFSGCMTAYVAILLKDAGLPAWCMIAILLLVGVVSGGLISAIPAYIDNKFKADVVVTSLMLNYVLLYFTQYILKYVIKDRTLSIPASVKLPAAASFQVILPGTTVHSGLFITLAAVGIAVFIFYKTKFGFTMRCIGSNPTFAQYTGIRVNAGIVLTQIVGGMFAGLGGTVEILGRYKRFQWTALTNHGFDGLMVAVLAHKKPELVPVAALLLAYIRTGADVVNRTSDIPPEFVSIIQGIIILLIAAEMFMSKYKNKIIFRLAKKSIGEGDA